MKKPLALLLSVALISCGDDTPVDQPTPDIPPADSAIADPPEDPVAAANDWSPVINFNGDGADAEESIQSFTDFLMEYDAAIGQADFAALISMSKHPFETRGNLDHYPHVFYAREHFLAVFNAFLKQELGEDMESENIGDAFRTYVLNDPNISITSDWGRIQDIQFEKTDGEWKAFFVYLEDETIDWLSEVPQDHIEHEQ